MPQVEEWRYLRDPNRIGEVGLTEARGVAPGQVALVGAIPAKQRLVDPTRLVLAEVSILVRTEVLNVLSERGRQCW